jgi:hypothetical protein
MDRLVAELDRARDLDTGALADAIEAIGVRDNYEPTDADGVVVHDSEGAKRPDGRPVAAADDRRGRPNR